MSLLRQSLAAAMLVVGGCSQTPAAAPPALLGVWTTSDPRYAGRAMQFDADGALRFVQGAGSVHEGWITSIEAESPQPSLLRYEIEYRGASGVRYPLELALDPSTGTLSIGRQKGVVWQKARSK